MGYSFLTLIIMALMTGLLPLFVYIFFETYVKTPLLLLFCFWVMCGYGYMITKASPHKPSTRAGLYSPLLTLPIWYLICMGICNLTNSTDSSFFIGFVTLHMFGLINDMRIPGCSWWHSALLWNLLYDAVLILGFTLGERLSVKKTGETRQRFSYHKKE